MLQALLAALSLVQPPTRVVPATTGVAMRVELERPQFLSTEQPLARVSIDNRTDDDLVLSGPQILDLVGNTWVDHSPAIRTISALPVARVVAAESTYDTNIPLPECAGSSSNCEHTIRVSIFLHDKRTGAVTKLSAQEMRYTIVPDPNETFYTPGDHLTTDRPALITFGSAEDTLFPDYFFATLTPLSENAQDGKDIFVALNKAFQSWLPASITDYDETSRSLLVGVPAKPVENVSHALRIIQRDFGSRTRINKTYYSVAKLDTLDSRSGAAAAELANDLARAVGTDVLNTGATEYRWGYLDYGSSFGGTYTKQHIPETWWAARAIQIDKPFTPTPVRLSLQQHFSEASHAAIAADPKVEKRARTAGASGLTGIALPTPFEPMVSMEERRPELFVTGGSVDAGAGRAGLSPISAAVYDADLRARLLASVLGLRTKSYSLLALYPMNQSTGVHALGLAISVVPGTGHLLKLPMYTNGIRVIAEDSHEINTPIDVSGPTYVSVTSGASVVQKANALVLDVKIERTDFGDYYSSFYSAPGDAGRSSRVVKRLLELPGVVRVPVSPPEIATRQFSLQYEVLVHPDALQNVNAILSFFKSAYAATRPRVTAVARAVVGGCEEAERALLIAAAHDAEGRINTTSPTAEARLMLAAESPLQTTGGVCGLPPRPQSRDFRAASAIIAIPQDVTLQLSLQLTYAR